MFKIYNCIATEHDLRLVGLAAAICAIASLAAIALLHHARQATGRMQMLWLAVSAISTGFGIWATHFIAMLAFSPGVPSGYNISLTLLSLVAAVLLTASGLAIALLPDWRPGPWLGGAIVAGGIAAMHYIGMAAFEIQGFIVWDATLVVASIVVGGALGAIALPVALHSSEEKWKAAGAVLLTLAICSHHFTAMGAAEIVPDPTVRVPDASLPGGWLAIGVALASIMIIALALAGVVLDVRDQRRSAREADRMLGLANAAVEGLVVCDRDVVATVNTSFARLACGDAADFVGKRIEDCFPDHTSRTRLMAATDQPIETCLQRRDGTMVPVEAIVRQIEFAGGPHQVVAVRDLRARKEAEQHIRYLAHHDALTTLPNRRHFNDSIEQQIGELAPGKSLAVLCLDLDRFKEINDLFGHATGDRVLQAAATRITALLGKDQMIARLGGDEFAVLMPNLADPSAAGFLAERILEALAAKDEAAALDSISSSIGIAICPDDSSESQTLLTHADTALYRAKIEGRGTYRFFEAQMGEAVRDRRLLEHDLRQSIANNQMHLVYQPQEDIQTGTVVGFEALLRWTHPVRGAVSPGVFIPIAEESGAILDIGEWVLWAACKEAASWDRPLTIAVNVSAIQIYNENFVHRLREILLETGLSPSRLELEITETALVRDLNRALLTLRQIKAMGIRIAMDDFGTGYSSLSNLRAFPFDKIKIDGSFVRSVNTNDQAATIVRAVLGLGRGLGLPVLAEGVETAAELKFLQDESCSEVQGYLLGRPATIDSFEKLTRNTADDGIPAIPPARKIA